MEIEEVLEKKYKMEKELLTYVSNLFNKFEEETGLYPNNIYFDDFLEETIGQKNRRIYTDCKITVEI